MGTGSVHIHYFYDCLGMFSAIPSLVSNYSVRNPTLVLVVDSLDTFLVCLAVLEHPEEPNHTKLFPGNLTRLELVHWITEYPLCVEELTSVSIEVILDFLMGPDISQTLNEFRFTHLSPVIHPTLNSVLIP